MDERAERIGKNEALFRRLNDRLKGIGESFSLVADRGDFVCECGDQACTEAIQMPLAEYEQLRSNPKWFAVLPGHVIPHVESVIERRDGYDIVEKHEGGPAELARDEDTRT
jgi:hypothetical protein